LLDKTQKIQFCGTTTNHASHSNHVSPHIWLSGYYRINF